MSRRSTRRRFTGRKIWLLPLSSVALLLGLLTPAFSSPAGAQVTIFWSSSGLDFTSAIPAGTELFFDYVNHDRTLIGDPLIYTNSYSCFNGSPPGTP